MSKINTCETCNYQTKYKQDYNRHLKSKHHLLKVNGKEWENTTHKCKDCEYETKLKTDLKRHVKRIHNDLVNVKYICLACCEYIQSDRDLKKHDWKQNHLRNLLINENFKNRSCMKGTNINSKVERYKRPLYIKQIDKEIKKENLKKVDEKMKNKLLKENINLTDEKLKEIYLLKIKEIAKKTKNIKDDNDNDNEDDKNEEDTDIDTDSDEPKKELTQIKSSDSFNKKMFKKYDMNIIDNHKIIFKLIDETRSLLDKYDNDYAPIHSNIKSKKDIEEEYNILNDEYQIKEKFGKKSDKPDDIKMYYDNYLLCMDIMTDDNLLKRFNLKW